MTFRRLLIVVVLTAAGDTLQTLRWQTRARRPFEHHALEEVYEFSPDGRYLLLSMNTPQADSTWYAEYNNTVLHCLALNDGTERVVELGAFCPTALQVSSEGAVLNGDSGVCTWRDETFGEVYWSITWSPWSLRKHVKW